MIVEQVWTGNAYRNFNYLVACPETGDALAVDPLDYKKCLGAARGRGWTITQILNTCDSPLRCVIDEHFVYLTPETNLINVSGGGISQPEYIENWIEIIDGKPK